MKRSGVFNICLCLLALSVARADDLAVQPTGIYKTIDVHLANDTIKTLLTSKGTARLEVINTVGKSPEDFAPPVLYALSSVLFELE